MRLSTRTLIRLCRVGQAFCLLMSLSGALLILASPTPADAQACRSVCESGDDSACLACEQVEHHPGNVAAGSLLVLGGLGGTVALGQLCHGLEQGGAGGMPGDGEQRDSAYTLPDPGNLANFLSSLGLTNSDGTPVDTSSVSSLYDQYDERPTGGRRRALERALPRRLRHADRRQR